MNTLVVILGILTIVAGVFSRVFSMYIYKGAKRDYEKNNRYNNNAEPFKEYKPNKSFAILIVFGLVLLVFSQSFTIIATGYTGVRSVVGQINEKPAPNGFNFKIPFVEKIYKINNKQQDIVFEDNYISSETLERNTVTFSGITVTYKINPEKSAWIVINVANHEDNLVNEILVASAIKTTSKTLSPTDVTNRSILEPKAQENIQKSIDEKYGEGVVEINKVVINNATFDKEYDDKIAKKQQAQMDYERQQIENKKNVEKAEADAKVKKLNAQAEAEASKLLEKSLTDKVLQSKMLDKWDGVLPKITGNSNAMIDVGNILGE